MEVPASKRGSFLGDTRYLLPQRTSFRGYSPVFSDDGTLCWWRGILPALTDFIMMVEDTSYMFVTGPNVVKTVTHEEVTAEELGGASAHSTKSGVTHFTYPNEISLIEGLKKLLSYVPQNCDEEPPIPVRAGR